MLDAALVQLPVDPAAVEVIARADSAGLSHGFVDACRARHVRFAIGHRLTAEIAKVLVGMPESVWQPALSADGHQERDGAAVVEITGLVDLSAWGEGMRMIARREDPHPGAQLTFTDVDGHRFQVFVTDLPERDIAYSKRCIADAVRPNDRSATPKTPAWPTCPRRTSRSTPRGSPSCSSRTTCSPGPDCSASTATSHARSPNGFATAFSTQLRDHPERTTRRLRVAANWPWRDQLIAWFASTRSLPIRG